MKISFFGATEEVTGSRYLIEDGTTKILVDCGLFQGDKATRKRNWDPFPVDASSINAIVLTHAHIDHSGYIPVLIKKGFRGKIYCSKATYALCAILLVDSGTLQEEDAQKITAAGYSEHKPALPLYTAADATASLKFFQSVDYNQVLNLGSFTITLIPCGHILGSSFIILSDGKQTLTFSGDLGAPDQLIMKAPEHLKQTDFLVLESTYGDRLHEHIDSLEVLKQVINSTVAKGGVVIMPAFAVGRAQTILYCLYLLRQKNAIPSDVPIFLDSPMAINVTDLFCKYQNEHKLPANACSDVFNIATYVRSVEESKGIDQTKGSKIIIAGSGMANGGRVLDHLKHFISDAKNTVLFLGYQSIGTLGRALVDGAKRAEIYGRSYEVNAEIKMLDTLSAHADYEEILTWLSYFERAPKKVFLTHGEKESAEALKKKIEERFGWSVVVPKYLESFNLD